MVDSLIRTPGEGPYLRIIVEVYLAPLRARINWGGPAKWDYWAAKLSTAAVYIDSKALVPGSAHTEYIRGIYYSRSFCQYVLYTGVAVYAQCVYPVAV